MSNTHPLATRPTYTSSQLSTFLSALPCQPPLTLASFQDLKSQSPLTALRKLHLLTLGFAPFGSLAIHYSPSRIISIDPEYLYRKIVLRRQGGYCMEMNCFWSTVLRSLGFDCYVVGARVSHAEGGAKGWNRDGFGSYGHEVVIVRIEGHKWLSDVGFGARMSTEPIRLKVGQRGKGLLGWWQRLDFRAVADFTQADHKLWVVDVTDEWSTDAGVDADGTENGNGIGAVDGRSDLETYAAVQSPPGYRPAYCFSDVEWSPADFDVLNYRMCRDTRSIFVQMFMMVRPILNADGTKCIGQLTFTRDELSRTMSEDGGQAHEKNNKNKEVLVKCGSEKERVDALKEWFGIALTDDEVRGIQGLGSEIRE